MVSFQVFSTINCFLTLSNTEAVIEYLAVNPWLDFKIEHFYTEPVYKHPLG